MTEETKDVSTSDDQKKKTVYWLPELPSSRFSIDDFQAEVAYTLRDYKRVLLPPETKEIPDWRKKHIKKHGDRESRNILNAVTYEVSPELTFDILQKLQKTTRRQMITNFWEARVPHESMFMAWPIFPTNLFGNREDKKHPPLTCFKEYEAFEFTSGFIGCHIQKEDARHYIFYDQPSKKTEPLFPKEFFTYTIFYGLDIPGQDRLKILHLPCSLANSAFCEGASQKPWTAIEQRATGKIRVKHNDGENQEIDPIFAGKFLSVFGPWGSQPLTAHFRELIMETKKEVFMEDADPLHEILNHLTQLSTMYSADDTGKNCFYIWEMMSRGEVPVGGFFSFIMGVLAMHNYDWIVKDPVARETKVRGINQRQRPRNRHYKLEVKLPKEKAIVDGAQPPRTARYGTAYHEVKGHKRVYRYADGSIKKEVYINSHYRGDTKFGIVTKDYVLTKNNQNDEDDE